MGKTTAASASIKSPTVHPHVCGENLQSGDYAVQIDGSPPRVWGKHESLCKGESKARFTPTCVGKTHIPQQLSSLPTVHPHVCGENFLDVYASPGAPGSPPRVWGKQLMPMSYPRRARFTPTCVGKTCPMYPDPSRDLVHPHVCGENYESSQSWACSSGSPPRVWGKLYDPLLKFLLFWFTPTCVGKTISPDTIEPLLEVHPHVCGENSPA